MERFGGERVPSTVLRADADNTCPHRVLVVSADMGGGHNATAAALEQAVQRRWPGSEIHRVDALDVMGSGIGPLFRKIYVSNVEKTPWLYEFFYANLWRHRWFAHSSKRFVGSWCGRRLANHVNRFDPDLILCTYPLGSAGLAWLRTHRGLSPPTGCWISDMAPHPFWVYPELDCNFVMDESAIAVALAAEPEARVEVSPLPVVDRFRPGDQEEARDELGLPRDTLIVLLSCGSYSFGDTDAIVKTVSAAADNVTVLAVCGRDDVCRQRLDGLGLPRSRLRTFGWTEKMPQLTRAADIVLTNAGGATALEALATGTPVVSIMPIAAHGTANASLMTVAGLSDICSEPDRLTALVVTASHDRATLDPLRRRVTRRPTEGALENALDTLVEHASASEPVERAWPMRASDSFFAQVEDDGIPQEVGAVLELGRCLDGTHLGAAALCETLQARMAGLPTARRVLLRHPLGWHLAKQVDVTKHVEAVELAEACSMQELWDRISEFWAEPLLESEPGWKMLLVNSPNLQHSLFAAKLHHCLGDGISALGLLDRLLNTEQSDPLPEQRTCSRQSGTGLRFGHVVRGLGSRASRGMAPHHPLNSVAMNGQPQLVSTSLRWSEVRRVAKSLDAHPHELLIGLVADVLCTLLTDAKMLRPGEPLRAAVPIALRPPRLDRIFGNWTGSLAVDLPTGPMSPIERVAQVREEVRRRVERGEPEAAAAAMWLTGHLPDFLHRVIPRTVYDQRFFNTIVSYIPAARGRRWLVDAPVRTTTPVLPLVSGVPLTVGVVVAGDAVNIGILLDDALGLSDRAIHDQIETTFTSLGGRMFEAAEDFNG